MTPPAASNPASLAAEKELRELRDRFAMRALPFCCVEAVREFAHVKSTHFDAVNHAREAAKRAYVIAEECMKIREAKS